MKNILLIFPLLSNLLVKPSAQGPTDPLKVSIYYESLCPYCIMFVKEQLYPSYEKLGSSLLLDFVPYGNVLRKQENGTWVFDCQHGPDECAINKIQACGLARTSDQDKQMEFVYCIESQAKAKKTKLKKLAKCASKLGLIGKDLLSCSEGPEGNELLAKLADKQEALHPNVDHVPWLIFNDQPYNSRIEEAALTDFLQTVCYLLSYTPETCSQFNKLDSNE